MDELTLLRNVRNDAEAPTATALNRGRTALLERAASPRATESPAGPARNRRGLRVGVTAFAAVALGATLVLTNTVGLAGWRGGAEPAAAAILHEAADAAIRTVDPALLPGQYLRVEQAQVYSAWSDDPAFVGDDNPEMVGWLSLTETDLYVPADTADEWVWLRSLARPYETFGEDSERVAQASWNAVIAEVGADHVERLRAPGGQFFGIPNAWSTDGLSELPRDPYRLLNHIYRVTLGQGPTPDREAFTFLADRLSSGAVPAELRAAMYEAAAMIPGVTLTETGANLDGRTGVAIGIDDGIYRREMIVEPSSGTFLGERSVLLAADGNMPAGTVTTWTAVNVSIVDSAPEGGSVFGDVTSQCADPRGC